MSGGPVLSPFPDIPSAPDWLCDLWPVYLTVSPNFPSAHS